jgi:hypothetical protein
LVFGAQPADETVAFFGSAIAKDDRIFTMLGRIALAALNVLVR